MNDTAGVKDGLPQARAPCRCTLIEAVPAVLWQQARHRCDLALAQGSTFVAILRAAQAFAEEGVLADADRQRAARFRQAADRHNFVLGRTLVHHLVRPAGAPCPTWFPSDFMVSLSYLMPLPIASRTQAHGSPAR